MFVHARTHPLTLRAALMLTCTRLQHSVLGSAIESIAAVQKSIDQSAQARVCACVSVVLPCMNGCVRTCVCGIDQVAIQQTT